MGAMSRGWALTKQSWAVLRNDKSLAIFPILSTIIALIALVAVWLPTAVLTGLYFDIVDDNNPIFGVASVVTCLLTTFIAIFFNVALASCAARSLRGEDTRVGEGLEAAMQRMGPILGWTAVAGTVGLFLSLVRDRLPGAKLALWIVGAAWEVATFFVIPVIAIEGTGPWPSLKRSVTVVKARWGEGATGAATIAVMTVLAALPLAFVGSAGVYALSSEGFSILGFVAAAVGVSAVIVVSIISSALNGIFRVAVYLYGVTGQAPAAFDAALVRSAFEQHAHRGRAPVPDTLPYRGGATVSD
jgi:hypothetical protein